MSVRALPPTPPDPATIPLPAQIVALLGSSAELHHLLLQSLFRRAARGEHLALLVGDNRFDAYRLARLARTRGADPAVVLAQIALTRAFTCYQLHGGIVAIRNQPDGGWDALYVAGLLDLFYDQDVQEHEARRLLYASLSHLRQIAARGLPILLTLAPPREQGRASFVQIVQAAVDAYWQPSPLALALPVARQPELFVI